MDTDRSDSKTGVGVYGRRLALAVFLVVALVASRGAIGVVGDFASDVNWLAGIVVVVVLSVIPLWFLLRYEDSSREE